MSYNVISHDRSSPRALACFAEGAWPLQLPEGAATAFRHCMYKSLCIYICNCLNDIYIYIYILGCGNSYGRWTSHVFCILELMLTSLPAPVTMRGEHDCDATSCAESGNARRCGWYCSEEALGTAVRYGTAQQGQPTYDANP